jgi:hypothetical protein
MKPPKLENIQKYEISNLLEWLRFCTKSKTGNYSEEVGPTLKV